jgi:predicted phage tail protein
VSDVFLQPIMKMIDKLGISKTASEASSAPAMGISNAQLAKELGKLAGDMPEDIAGQDMHDEKTPMDTPESPPASPKLENSQDSAYRLQQRTDDNLDNLSQSSAPLSNPSDLDTDQDPLARMAAKIACAIEPMLKGADSALNSPAERLCAQIDKTAAPALVQNARQWMQANPEIATASALGAGGLIGGGLGFFGGKHTERKKDETEDSAIFELGAQVGGQAVANQVIEHLQAAASGPDQNKEG